jgi:hypothetical protein
LGEDLSVSVRFFKKTAINVLNRLELVRVHQDRESFLCYTLLERNDVKGFINFGLNTFFIKTAKI